MSLWTLLGLLVGATIGGLLVLAIALFRGWSPVKGPIQRVREWWGSKVGRRMAYSVGVGLVVLLLSRWPVAAVAAGAGFWVWPALFGASRDSASKIEKLEALVTWTESLRDTIAGAVSLEQAIPRSLDSAAPALHGPLSRLVGLVERRVPLQQALARFGTELNDPTADQIIASLWLNTRLRGPGLASTLTELVATAREELEMRRRIEETRRALHRGVRIVVAVIVTFVTAVSVFSRDFVQPYSTVTGQMVLIVIIAVFTLGLLFIRKAATIPEPERFLADEAQLASLGGI